MKLAQELLMTVDGFDGTFLNITNKLLEEISEASDSELVTVKSQVEKIRDAMSQLRVKMYKEKQAGKSDSVLEPLKKMWSSFQNKIVQLWAAYDKKHGTKYHNAYVQ